jgi:hypothetical protein
MFACKEPESQTSVEYATINFSKDWHCPEPKLPSHLRRGWLGKKGTKGQGHVSQEETHH